MAPVNEDGSPSATLLSLTARLATVEADVRSVKEETKSMDSKLDTVLEFVTSERAVRKQWDKYEERRAQSMEMSWSKVVALATIIGVLISLAQVVAKVNFLGVGHG
jgi:hypothetical protein